MRSNHTRRVNVGIHQNVYDRLVRHGKFGDSFSDIIERLLDDVEKK
jgi:predicted CopG family antitoxin